MTKWQMNRAGLLNFWYYDEEIFSFEEGKLLLRGTNGSGKSVTMQSFIPVLLDGKKTPDRLDPFGSKARKMSDYLLGEEEISKREERTGYLFIEYKMKDTEQYITTGIGMQARRHKDLKSWYFVLTDNRRIGVDFELAHRSATEIVPFSQKELQHRIGAGGVVVDSQSSYAELVNKHIFGFETMEAYEDLVKLLIQLRAPKLSKDFKPTVIYEILESALPPLTDDELRHLSDTIESMDQTQQQLEQLTAEYEANAKIKQKYDAYNQYILAERASRVIASEEKLQTVEHELREKKSQLVVIHQTTEKLQEEHRILVRNLEVAGHEEESLKSHEVWNLQKELTKKEQEQVQVGQQMKKLQERKSNEQSKRIRQLATLKTWQEDVEESLLKQKEILQEMSSLASEAVFYAHDLNVESMQRETMQFDYWQQEVQAHKDKLREMKKLVSEQSRLTENDRKLERDSSEKTKQIDLLQKELEQAEHWFDEELQKLEHSLFNWMDRYPVLNYSAEQKQQISHVLHNLYEKAAYYEAKNSLIEGLNNYRAELTIMRKTNEQQQRQLQQQKADYEKQLERLRREELAEPTRLEGTTTFRQSLLQKGIPFVPFYAGVEFQSHVTTEQKSRLEAVLVTTGILDSLISPQTFDVVEDALLQPNAQLLGYTLADFLQPDVEMEGITSALIDEVLRSIPIEQDGEVFTLDERGFYKIGALVGHAPQQGPSKFIGRTSRKRYQQEQIEAVQVQLSELEQVQQLLLTEQGELHSKLAEVDEWQQQIPVDRTLYEVYEEMTQTATKQKVLKDQLKQIDEMWQHVRQQLREIRQQLLSVKDTLNIAQTKDALNGALQQMDDYLKELFNLQLVRQNQVNLQDRLAEGHTRLEEIEEALDRYHQELVDQENRQEKNQAEITSIERQLKLQGADEIRARIQQLQGQLTGYKKREREIIENLPRLSANADVIANEQERLIKEQHFTKLLMQQWQKAFQDEIALAFVSVEDATVQQVEKQYRSFLQMDRVKLQEQLSKAMNSEMNQLNEYHVKDYLKETELLPELAASNDDRIDSFKQLRGRRIIELEYRGQRVSPYYIDQSLQEELQDRRYHLDEQDRELYEDIIVNSVGRILRQRIARASQWVKEMDAIMAKRDNSSGLIFSISWKPRTAEGEDELDTKDLVLLMQRKSSFLSEEDLQKITKHFRSRIESAKESIGLRNEGNTLHQVLKEVLDYRTWFSFVLSFTRQNETKKELTNNAFFKFSGGEKAMAMYIPLFTAAYSRYKEASDMAPYIISLDEAFAGVDEQNIRDMFEVVEQLGFNYIMNSQVIWGDYDTVSSLAISELVRPKNADFVTVFNYTWNGKERVLNG